MMLQFSAKDFPLPGVVLFGHYRFAASQVELPTHSHEGAIEICFLQRGEQTYRVGRSLERLRGNDQFFTLPGEIHDSAKLPQERGILYWMILDLQPRRPFLGLSTSAAADLKQSLRRMPVRHFHGHSDCARILGEMTDRLVRPGSDAVLARLRIQSLLLDYLTLTIAAAHRGEVKQVSLLMRRVLGFIREHAGDPIEVRRLAAAARLSESHFKARFKRETGVPPAEFWLRQKIELAKALLPRKSVTEVAHALGFSSSQYFATAFKRYTRMNPSHLQRPEG